MSGETHAVVGAAAALGVGVVAGVGMPVGFALGAAGIIGGLLPDSDLQNTRGRTVLVGGALASVCLLGRIVYDWMHGGVSGSMAGIVPLAVWCIAYFVLVQHQHSHRGFAHSLTSVAATAAVLMVSLGTLGVSREVRLIAVSLVVGMISHLVLDLFNKKGIQLLYPVKKRVCFGVCRHDGIANSAVAAIAATLVAAEIMRLF